MVECAGVSAHEARGGHWRTVAGPTDALEAAWREAVTSIIVPMLQGAAVHTAMVAEQIAIDMPSP